MVVDSVSGNSFKVSAPSRVMMLIDTDDLSIKSVISTSLGFSNEEIRIGKVPAIIHSYMKDSLTIKNFIVRHGINAIKTGLNFGYY